MSTDPSTVHVLIVYESMFGNTAAIARSIADGISPTAADVDVTEIGDAPFDLRNVDFLIVGGPTHAFGMTRPSTRRRPKGTTSTDPTPIPRISSGIR